MTHSLHSSQIEKSAITSRHVGIWRIKERSIASSSPALIRNIVIFRASPRMQVS